MKPIKFRFKGKYIKDGELTEKTVNGILKTIELYEKEKNKKK